MQQDILDRLRIDPGRRTLGELIQDRERAAQEVAKLRGTIERLHRMRSGTRPKDDDDTNHEVRAALLPGKLLRLTELTALLGTSCSTIYKWVAEGSFPAPVHISERVVRRRIE
jgi:predicted DNA-binding transcriptional regulator AlpA